MSTTQLWRILGVVLGLLVAGAPAGAWAEGAPVDAATKEQTQAATTAFTAARRLFDKGDFQGALEGFRESCEAVASPNTQVMIVRSLVHLGRLAEAYTTANEAAEEAAELAAKGGALAKYATAAESLNKAVSDLRPKIGLLTVTVSGAPPGAEMTLDGKPVDPGLWGKPMPVDPARMMVTLTGFDPQEVLVPPGTEMTVSFAPPKPPADEDDDGADVTDLRVAAFIAGGIGAAGMICFGIFGGLTVATYNDLKESCSEDSSCRPEQESDVDQGIAFRTTANVSLVVGIVGLAAGTGLLVWSLLDSGEDGESDEGELDSLAVRVGPGSVYLDGKF